MATELQRTSTVGQLAGALQAEILAGNLAPGSRLRETEVAARFGVSRNTLREAFLELGRGGLVEHHPHRGATVARPSIAEVREVFRIRRALEPAALRGIDPPRLRRLTVLAEALEKAAEHEDWPALADLDVGFHAQVVEGMSSPRLDEFFLSLLYTLRLAFIAADRLSAGTAPPAHVAEHRRIVETLGGGRVDEAVSILSAHLDHSEQLVLEGLAAEGA